MIVSQVHFRGMTQFLPQKMKYYCVHSFVCFLDSLPTCVHYCWLAKLCPTGEHMICVQDYVCGDFDVRHSSSLYYTESPYNQSPITSEVLPTALLERSINQPINQPARVQPYQPLDTFNQPTNQPPNIPGYFQLTPPVPKFRVQTSFLDHGGTGTRGRQKNEIAGNQRVV